MSIAITAAAAEKDTAASAKAKKEPKRDRKEKKLADEDVAEGKDVDGPRKPAKVCYITICTLSCGCY